MKIRVLEMMLATMPFLGHQECVSQSLKINVANLIYKDDINITGSTYYRINALPGTNKLNGDYTRTSAVKYNNNDLMTIKWSDRAISNTIDIEQVQLYYVPNQNIHINLVVPGAVALGQSYSNIKPIKIKNKAFANIGAADVTLGVAFLNPEFGWYNVTFDTDCSRQFENSSSIISLDFRGTDTINVTNMNSMFEGCDNLQELRLDNFSMWNCCNNRDNMFLGCTNLATLMYGTASITLPTGINYDPQKTLEQACLLLDLGS